MYPQGFNPKMLAVGLNSTKKALRANNVQRVFLGYDADPRLSEAVHIAAAENGVEVDESCSMEQLGSFCGIEVPCAVCSVVFYK